MVGPPPAPAVPRAPMRRVPTMYLPAAAGTATGEPVSDRIAGDLSSGPAGAGTATTATAGRRHQEGAGLGEDLCRTATATGTRSSGTSAAGSAGPTGGVIGAGLADKMERLCPAVTDGTSLTVPPVPAAPPEPRPPWAPLASRQTELGTTFPGTIHVWVSGRKLNLTETTLAPNEAA